MNIMNFPQFQKIWHLSFVYFFQFILLLSNFISFFLLQFSLSYYNFVLFPLSQKKLDIKKLLIPDIIVSNDGYSST